MYNDYKTSVEDYIMQGDIANFIYKVYGWMAIALTITASVAYYISTMPVIAQTIFSNPFLLIGLFIAQLGVVVAISGFVNRLNYSTAVALFLVYAASVGLTFSVIFLHYTFASIALTFLITAGMFGAMCLYGYFTKADLSSWGSIGLMLMVGLIIGFLANLYFKNPMLDYILSGIGVIVFTGLTAFDMQKIKQLGYHLLSDYEMLQKVSVLGALTLYLDFINLFIMLLRFTGRSRD
ncbi:MAG TPA: Bax inhibitor-1/YccA family protein [Candidatus Babeliales bacterium]|nr:Bax inhibitor-1/YccA family protein [Candidatus Babeliales bacterium]